jgi:short-subunit dehydrogenase
MRLRQAAVLVTGASSGLGRQTAIALAAAGAQVIVHGRDETRLTELARLVGGVPIIGDLAGSAGVEALAEAALGATGRVDVLINNAGVGWAGPFEDMPGEAVRALVAVNLAAPVALTRLLLPQMTSRGSGHLVFVSSIAGRLGVAGEALYAATKAGLDVFAESLRLELRGRGVGVGVLVPGVIDTPFFERRGSAYPRARPRPVSAQRAADALVRGVEAGTAEIYVPAWLRLPVTVRGVLPGAYRALAGRFGQRAAGGA